MLLPAFIVFSFSAVAKTGLEHHHSSSVQKPQKIQKTQKTHSASDGSTSQLLKPFDITYIIKTSKLPFKVSAKSKLSYSDNQWLVYFKASAMVMSYKEKSRFIYNANHTVHPLEYERVKSVLGSKEKENVRYDWANKKASYTKNDKTQAIALSQGALDEMSYQTQLRLDLLKQKKSPLYYKIVGKHGLYNLKLRADGKEILKTSIGNLNTLRFKTVRKNNKRETWIWLAPKWQYLPVKIKQRTGSENDEIEISGGTFNGKSITEKSIKG